MSKNGTKSNENSVDFGSKKKRCRWSTQLRNFKLFWIWNQKRWESKKNTGIRGGANRPWFKVISITKNLLTGLWSIWRPWGRWEGLSKKCSNGSCWSRWNLPETKNVIRINKSILTVAIILSSLQISKTIKLLTLKKINLSISRPRQKNEIRKKFNFSNGNLTWPKNEKGFTKQNDLGRSLKSKWTKCGMRTRKKINQKIVTKTKIRSNDYFCHRRLCCCTHRISSKKCKNNWSISSCWKNNRVKNGWLRIIIPVRKNEVEVKSHTWLEFF